MAVSYNTYTDLTAAIDPIIAEVAGTIASRLRKGQNTDALDNKLARLWLIRQASAHFSVEDIHRAFTYLTLFANV